MANAIVSFEILIVPGKEEKKFNKLSTVIDQLIHNSRCILSLEDHYVLLIGF
jgi:hypothetical protein